MSFAMGLRSIVSPSRLFYYCNRGYARGHEHSQLTLMNIFNSTGSSDTNFVFYKIPKDLLIKNEIKPDIRKC